MMSTLETSKDINQRTIPRPTIQRMMSHPITKIEKLDAIVHPKNEVEHVSKKEVKQENKINEPSI